MARIKITHRFNWKFWRPVRCIAGPVYWGSYWIIEDEGRTLYMTDLEFRIKADMGLFREDENG